MDFMSYKDYNNNMQQATIKQSRQSSRPDDSPLVVIEVENALQEPAFYHVILLNDDYTPMDFVIRVLMELFHKNYDNAYAIMMEVHELQRGIAGTYSREIAEEKRESVLMAAEANGFPLNCIVEQALWHAKVIC